MPWQKWGVWGALKGEQIPFSGLKKGNPRFAPHIGGDMCNRFVEAQAPTTGPSNQTGEQLRSAYSLKHLSVIVVHKHKAIENQPAFNKHHTHASD